MTGIHTGTVEPASASNLVLSEFMYHPADPVSGEINAGFADADLFEFVELMNIAAVDVSLDGVRFTGGINHALPSVVLAPGERRVLARKRDAFLHRYPGAAGSLLDGEYFGIGDTNQLSNSGEQIVLSDALSADILRFSYSHDLLWPTSADGAGFSLELIAPASNPDHALVANWRSSGSAMGTPGSSDATTFVGDPEGDDDSDGLNNFIDYALGNTSAPQFLPGAGESYSFSFRRNLLADDVKLTVESSPDLVSWGSTGLSLQSLTSLGGGLELQTWVLDRQAGPRLFLRLVARAR